jgi:hypothetical protein
MLLTGNFKGREFDNFIHARTARTYKANLYILTKKSKQTVPLLEENLKRRSYRTVNLSVAIELYGNSACSDVRQTILHGNQYKVSLHRWTGTSMFKCFMPITARWRLSRLWGRGTINAILGTILNTCIECRYLWVLRITIESKKEHWIMPHRYLQIHNLFSLQ